MSMTAEEIYKGMSEELKQDLRNALETKELSTIARKHAIRPGTLYNYLCILNEFEGKRNT